MHHLALCAQVIIACSIAFVWIARFPNVVREFHEYGLHDYIRCLVGAAKVALATLICVSIWHPSLAILPALLMACLMACALAAHWTVHHAWQKYVPAALLLGLSLFVADVYAGSLLMLIAFSLRMRMRDSISVSLASFLFVLLNLYIFIRSTKLPFVTTGPTA